MAATVKMTLKEYRKYIKRLGERLVPAATRGVQSAGFRGVMLLQARTRTAPPASPNGSVGAVNTGRYLQSWKHRPLDRGVVFTNTAPYSPIIEKGRRRNKAMPPRDAIAKWAQRRLGLTAHEAKQAAFPIARAIGKRGLKGRRVVKDSLKELKKLVLDEMMYEFDRELSKK